MPITIFEARASMKAASRKKPLTVRGLDSAKEVMLGLRRERGALSRLAVQLGVTAQAVHLWEVVPIHRVLDVERITGIPRQRLRPDYFIRD